MSDIIVEIIKESQVISVGDQGPPGTPGPIVYLDYGKFDSNLVSITQLGIQDLHTFSYTAYGAAKYIIYANYGLNRQVCEVLLLQDGETITIVEYANLVSGMLLGTFSASIYGGKVHLEVNPTEVGTQFKVIRTLIADS